MTGKKTEPKKKTSKNIVYYPSRKNRTFLKESQKSSNNLFVLLISFSTLLGILCFILYIQKENMPSKLAEGTVSSHEEIGPTVVVSSRDLEMQVTETVKKEIKSEETSTEVEDKNTSEIQSIIENRTSYQVVPGDTLSQIAEKVGITVKELKEFNHLENEVVTSGQILSLIKLPDIPVSHPVNEKYIVQIGDTLFKIAQKNGLTVEDIRQVNALNSSELHPGQELIMGKGTESQNLDNSVTSDQNRSLFYEVQPGDTIYRIANNHHTTVENLEQLNGLVDYTIQAGSILKIN